MGGRGVLRAKHVTVIFPGSNEINIFRMPSAIGSRGYFFVIVVFAVVSSQALLYALTSPFQNVRIIKM